MQEQENQKNNVQEAIINYIAPREINIGDVFYIITETDYNRFFTRHCKVCDDIGKLTVNGVTFDCPCCDKSDTEKSIQIKKYIVKRYRVFKIEDRVDSTYWKAGTSHMVQFSLYTKSGAGSWGNNERKTYYAETFKSINNSIEELKKGWNTGFYNDCRNFDGMIYDDYKLACEVAAMATDYEIKKLNAFNAENGTKFVPAFKSENDKKEA